MSGSRFLIDSNQALTIAEQGQPSFTGIAYNTASQALPITLHWGTRRISSNAIWASSLTRQYPNSNSNSALLPITTAVPLNNGVTAVGNIPTVNPTNPDDASAYAFGAAWLGSVTVTYAGGIGGDFSYGNTDINSSDSTWFTPAIQAICEGPIDTTAPLNSVNGVNRIWQGSGGSPAMLWSAITTFPGDPLFLTTPRPAPPMLYYQVFNGSSTQNPWAFFSASSTSGLYSGQNLAYRGLAYVASPFVWKGHNNTFPSIDYEVCKTVSGYSLGDSYGIGVDMSPAYILQDMLTNVQYGLGLQSTDIDSTSLATYRSYCGALGVFLSPLLSGQQAGTDIIDRLAMESNTWIYFDGIVFRCVPLGDEALSAGGYSYTPDTGIAYDLSNNDFIGPLQVDRADPIDCSNKVHFEYPDRGNSYGTNSLEWKDSTLINQVGERDAGSVSADDICDPAVAAIALDLYAKRLAYIRLTFTFTLSYRYVRIVPGTLLTLNDPNLGLSAFPVRVRSVEEADDYSLRIVAEEWSGVLGIARPAPVQAWTASGGGSSGSASATPVGGTSGIGTPISTSGGTGTLATPNTAQVVFFVAGDSISLPVGPTTGQVVYFKNDLQRVPQPTDPDLDSNPAKVVVPSGATYTVEDASDQTAAAGTSASFKVSGGTWSGFFDGGSPGVWRWLNVQ